MGISLRALSFWYAPLPGELTNKSGIRHSPIVLKSVPIRGSTTTARLKKCRSPICGQNCLTSLCLSCKATFQRKAREEHSSVCSWVTFPPKNILGVLWAALSRLNTKLSQSEDWARFLTMLVSFLTRLEL